MGEWADRVMAKVRDRIETEVDAAGVDITADVRAAISTPVVRDNDGNVIQRSDPNTDPWLETGVLWESQGHDVATDAHSVQVNFTNTAYYARSLNIGHDNIAPRPFWLHVTSRAKEVRDRVRDAILGKR